MQPQLLGESIGARTVLSCFNVQVLSIRAPCASTRKRVVFGSDKEEETPHRRPQSRKPVLPYSDHARNGA